MVLKIIKKPAAPVEDIKKADKAAAADGSGNTAGATSKSSVKEIGPATLMAQEPMCMVSLMVGYSHKLPNEDWVKIEIKLEIPAKHEDIDKAHDYIKEWTDAKLNDKVTEILAEAE
jgi:hypothetical protein